MPNPSKDPFERELSGVRLRHGTPKATEPLGDDGGEVVAPDWLRPAALEYFEEMAGHLREKKLLAGMDATPIAIYAEQLCRFVELKAQVWNGGDGSVSMKDGEGNEVAVQQKPGIQELFKLMEKIEKFHDRFGGSPKARVTARVAASSSSGVAGQIKNGHTSVAGNPSPEFAAAVSEGVDARQDAVA